MTERPQICCSVNFGMIVASLFTAALYFPGCRSQGNNKCTLNNGRAVLLTPSDDGYTPAIYNFSCNDGYILRGYCVGHCNAYEKPYCVECPSYPLKRCGELYYEERQCCCGGKSVRNRKWGCNHNSWGCPCPALAKSTEFDISYSEPKRGRNYPDGTVAFYRCKRVNNDESYTEREMIWQRKCSDGLWTKQQPKCGCKAIADVRIKYNPPRKNGNNYPLGTEAAYICPKGSPIPFPRKCTTNGWTGKKSIQICAHSSLSTVPPDEESHTTGHHEKDERTLVIVSGTTGAILGALIILVVIVSCQRRLHYHRVRRARLRCRQDQEAFAAYITYHRDVRCMLPSYDEAINQQQQGQPPTFDEAVASNERPSPNETSVDETSPSTNRHSPVPITVDSETVVIRSSGTEPSRSSDEGRFVRALRILFRGRVFPSQSMYRHLMPQIDEEEENNSSQSGSLSQEDGVRELNAALTRAGLC